MNRELSEDYGLYNSIPNLKAANVPVSLTEEQVDEYIKCSESCEYFLENYVKIVTQDEGLVAFKLWDWQKKAIKLVHENRRTILMVARQSAKTTTICGYLLWYVMFREDSSIAILADQQDAAIENLDRIKYMYNELPFWMQKGVIEWNKKRILLGNKSKITASATTRRGIRGKSPNIIFVDEAAIIPNNIAEDFFRAIKPAISKGKNTKLILASTPRGYNHFFRMWDAAEKGLNDYVPLKVHYSEVPGRDEKWFQEQLNDLGELGVAQEVLCNFLGSSATLIKPDSLDKIHITKHLQQDEEGLTIYEEPVKPYEEPIPETNIALSSKPQVFLNKKRPGNKYIIVADTSKGVGQDYSAFVILDVTTVPYKIVATYKNNVISPLHYPDVLHSVARHYNDAYILLENNCSEQVGFILNSDYNYENLLFTTRELMKGQQLTFNSGKKSFVGVSTDKKVKRIGCQNLKLLVESDKLIINSSDVKNELCTFIEVGGSYAADEGYHDDLVMCLVLFSWMTTEDFFRTICNSTLRNINQEDDYSAPTISFVYRNGVDLPPEDVSWLFL